MRVPKLTTRLVKMQEACDVLVVCHGRSGTGSTKCSQTRGHRLNGSGSSAGFTKDELAVAIKQPSRGTAPILNYRRIKGRI
ncbi:unnamed protein product [Gemmata massiliana]|uniref:Uncharacterized protein n=1 Tax=Gemmata massiliana TaxID=1210884 RepID=A0A6P2D3P6_9BACT|nr:unnamed protein product [Gemmata massiliana]